MPEDTESLRRDCQVERESQGLDFAEKAHWCAIWSQGRGPGRGNDYWQCHQGISERNGNDIRYGRHLQGGQIRESGSIMASGRAMSILDSRTSRSTAPTTERGTGVIQGSCRHDP